VTEEEHEFDLFASVPLDADITLLHPLYVDESGHQFGGVSPEYREATKRVDTTNPQSIADKPAVDIRQIRIYRPAIRHFAKLMSGPHPPLDLALDLALGLALDLALDLDADSRSVGRYTRRCRQWGQASRKFDAHQYDELFVDRMRW
jgi:hypothetical protein